MKKLRSLEGLRAVAALLVVLFHTQFILTSSSGSVPFFGLFEAGNRGVDLFFVLSGFIVAYVHGDDVGRPWRLPHYAFNRIARLYPAVWIMSAFALGFYALGFGAVDKAAKLAPGAITASVLLLPQPNTPLLNVAWTLAYEAMFYAAFATLIANRAAGIAILVTWQVAVLAKAVLDYVVLGNVVVHSYQYLRPICLEFGLGIGCAWWVRQTPSAMHPAAWLPVLAAGVVAFVAGMALDSLVIWGSVPCALGAAAIILALVRIEQTHALAVPAWLVSFGGASYSIYLVHYSVITVLAAVLARAATPISNPICLLCAAAGTLAGLLFDRLLDQPIQRWLRQNKVRFLGASALRPSVRLS